MIIRFSQDQTVMASKKIIHCMAVIANRDDLPQEVEELINELSVILAVMHKCSEAAPILPPLDPSLADKK